MPRIAISNFVGEMPRASTRLLPENAAQVATNCKLWSRELRPWRDFSTVNNPIKSGPIKTIYPLGSGAYYWMHWAEDGNAQISAVQSKFGGKSLLLDGVGDYVTGAAVALAAGTGFNRSIWFRATGLTTARAILSATENFKFAVKISATQNLEFSLGNGTSWTIANAVAGATTLVTGTWYRARVAWNGSTYKLYLSVDGAAETEQASVASAAAHASGTGTRLGAGRTPGCRFD